MVAAPRHPLSRTLPHHRCHPRACRGHGGVVHGAAAIVAAASDRVLPTVVPARVLAINHFHLAHLCGVDVMVLHIDGV